MDMIEILGALVVGGVTGAIAKDKLIGNPQLQAKIRELEGIYKENNNLREDKKKLSRQVEDLLSELKRYVRPHRIMRTTRTIWKTT